MAYSSSYLNKPLQWRRIIGVYRCLTFVTIITETGVRGRKIILYNKTAKFDFKYLVSRFNEDDPRLKVFSFCPVETTMRFKIIIDKRVIVQFLNKTNGL